VMAKSIRRLAWDPTISARGKCVVCADDTPDVLAVIVRAMRTLMTRAGATLLVVGWLATGCGSKSDSSSSGQGNGAGSGSGSAAGAGSTAAPLAPPTIGIDKIARMNFIYEAGSPAYEKAVAAYKKKDWPQVRKECEASLAKDPNELDAHRLLATALVQAGEPAAAVDHLVTALAADYFKYGPSFDDDADLKDFRAGPHGQSVSALAAKIKDAYAKKIATGVLVVARRSAFKWPAQPGVQSASSRGELYAYDRDSKRFLRLTHTDHQVAGFVRSPGGTETAVIGFDKVDHPKADNAPSLFARPWLVVLDADWKPTGPRVHLPAARVISVGYGAGDQLLVTTAPASGRWSVGKETLQAVSRGAGKLAKVAGSAPTPRIAMTLDEGRIIRTPEGIDAQWAGDPPIAASFKTALGGNVAVPESGQTAQSSIAVGPKGAHVAFATYVDPCAKDVAPSLYVADGKSGALKHVYTAQSRFASRWIDDTTLAYEDGEGAVRLWDATTQRESAKLDNKPGISLDVLSTTSGPLCKQAPPTIEQSGSGEEAMPPEAGSGSAGSNQGPTP